MAESDGWVRDVRQLQLPVLGRFDRGDWQVIGTDGAPVSAVQAFLAELSASDCAPSTCRSYAADLLRWMRFCAAVEVRWQQATRREVRDLVRWFRAAPNRQRQACLGSGGRPAPETLNRLRAAVVRVFDHPVIGRCQLHKIRNVADKLPDHLAATVPNGMRAAYHAESALAAEAHLEALAKELERTHPGAAGMGAFRLGRDADRAAPEGAADAGTGGA